MRHSMAILLALCFTVPAISDEHGTAVGQIKTRDNLVIMTLGEENETLFTIKDEAGAVLISEMSADGIRKAHPDLYWIVEEVIAKPTDASVTRARNPVLDGD